MKRKKFRNFKPKYEKAVLYLRYSSDNQREESIEGQRRECLAYAKVNKIPVIKEYVDRAFSATTDKRPSFQQMIRDSSLGDFDTIIVWKYDRFSRDRLQSITYKEILKNNGVFLVSATEGKLEGPDSILMESVLDGMNEYYSADLSQKVIRGLTENVINGKFNGGKIPYGYDIVDKKYQINQAEAMVVRRIFDEYTKLGKSMRQIALDLQKEGIKRKNGSLMDHQTVEKILKSRRYIGEYKINDTINMNAIPPIIDRQTFELTEKRIKNNRKRIGIFSANEEYLLGNKCFCQKCGSKMDGESGTSKSGKLYTYYKCNNYKNHKGCDLKSIPKDTLETAVCIQISECLKQNLDTIAKGIYITQKEDNPLLKSLTKQKEETKKKIENINNAIAMGVFSSSTKDLLVKLENDLDTLTATIAKESLEHPKMTMDQIKASLEVYFEYAGDDFGKKGSS